MPLTAGRNCRIVPLGVRPVLMPAANGSPIALSDAAPDANANMTAKPLGSAGVK